MTTPTPVKLHDGQESPYSPPSERFLSQSPRDGDLACKPYRDQRSFFPVNYSSTIFFCSVGFTQALGKSLAVFYLGNSLHHVDSPSPLCLGQMTILILTIWPLSLHKQGTEELPTFRKFIAIAYFWPIASQSKDLEKNIYESPPYLTLTKQLSLP